MHICQIRMTLAQWKDTMLFLMEEIRPQSHWDVEFVFHKLRFSHAFHYVAMQTELYPLMRNQTLEDDEKQDSDAQLPSVVSALLSSDHIEVSVNSDNIAMVCISMFVLHQ